MSQDIIRGILSDHGCFYLGTVVDGVKHRGVGAGGLVVAPQYIRHIIYMQDTELLLTIDPDRVIMDSEGLQELCREALGYDWDVTFHELGEVITGILGGDMSYLDWARLPIINQPEPEYVRQIFTELQTQLEECYPALTARLHSGQRYKWMPLDYRWSQMVALARYGKIEINYFNILGQLQDSADNYEVYESALSEIRLQRLVTKLRSIETNARRGIL